VRAVLDPNVLIAALLSRSGTPARLLGRWIAGEFELIVSPALLAELERALGYPTLAARIPPQDASDYVSLLRRRARTAEDPPDPVPRSSDPDDDYLPALAEAERAILVSGDRHLLDLAGRLPVDSPRAFLDRLDAAGS
jgi:uncharacterized protein